MQLYTTHMKIFGSEFKKKLHSKEKYRLFKMLYFRYKRTNQLYKKILFFRLKGLVGLKHS